MPINSTETADDETAGALAPRWALVVVHAPDVHLVGRRFELDGDIGFGRATTGGPVEGVDLAIEDSRLSRKHATVRTLVSSRRGASHELVDHESKNGSRVNGHVRTTSLLVRGDIIRLGDTVFELVRLEEGLDHVEDERIRGQSTAVARLLSRLDKVAGAELAVLLLGETGTGKELAAQYLHRGSGRRGPLVPVNCGAVPRELAESTFFGHVKGAFTGADTDRPGLFAQARGGTLFLDEVGELPLSLQPKLLRVLEDGQYQPVGGKSSVRADVRVVSATNADLAGAIERKEFRADLYARLAGYVVPLPPLRDRVVDIPSLFQHFIVEEGLDVELSAGFVEALLLYSWPMNVRELRALARELALEGETRLELRHLPQHVRMPRDSQAADSGPPDRTETSPDESLPGPPDSAATLEHLLKFHEGSVAAVAKRLGKDRRQIYRWLRKHRLSPDDFRAKF